jgi:hypothetical protein
MRSVTAAFHAKARLTSEPRGRWSVSYHSLLRAACPGQPQGRGAGLLRTRQRALASAGALRPDLCVAAQPPGPGRARARRLAGQALVALLADIATSGSANGAGARSNSPAPGRASVARHRGVGRSFIQRRPPGPQSFGKKATARMPWSGPVADGRGRVGGTITEYRPRRLHMGRTGISEGPNPTTVTGAVW